MSENNYAPGKGMHPEDLNALTEYCHRETNYINDKVDSAFKSAQDDAYARGYRRGREDLIEIRKQRDELLAVLIEARAAIASATLCVVFDRQPTDDEIRKLIDISKPGSDIGKINAAIASAKSFCVQQSAKSERQAELTLTDETQTSAPAIVFYPAGSLGEAVESEGGES